MAGGRAAIRMSEVEVASFLQGQVKVQVASLDRDGGPHLTTLFYVMDGERIAFWTYGRSQKIRSLERDPHIQVPGRGRPRLLELRGVSSAVTRWLSWACLTVELGPAPESRPPQR